MGGDNIKVRISLYNYYEANYNHIYSIYFITTTYSILIFSTLFIFKSIFITVFTWAVASIAVLGLVFFFYYLSTKEVILSEDKMLIVRKLGSPKILDVKDVIKISIGELPTRFAQMKKNRGKYYWIHFRLRNGKSVTVSENLYITTLLELLNKFLEFYENKLSPECVKYVQNFIKEKKPLIKNFENNRIGRGKDEK